MASLSEKPGNPAVAADSRLVFTMHPLNRPTSKLLERRAEGGGAAVPFPDPERSRPAFEPPCVVLRVRPLAPSEVGR